MCKMFIGKAQGLIYGEVHTNFVLYITTLLATEYEQPFNLCIAVTCAWLNVIRYIEAESYEHSCGASLGLTQCNYSECVVCYPLCDNHIIFYMHYDYKIAYQCTESWITPRKFV